MKLAKYLLFKKHFIHDIWNQNCKTLEGEQKKSTDVLPQTAKMIDPRVKSQARGQNNGSRALKWGIVHPCNLNGFGDMTKNKIMWFFWIFAFFTI